jgi:hypothetical protein
MSMSALYIPLSRKGKTCAVSMATRARLSSYLLGTTTMAVPSFQGGTTRPGGRVVGVSCRRPASLNRSYRFSFAARHVLANCALASSRLAQNPCDGSAGVTTAPVMVHIHGWTAHRPPD